LLFIFSISFLPTRKQEERLRDFFSLVLSVINISTIQLVRPSFPHRVLYNESEPEQALEY
jgi:hypothetical protein